MHGLLDAVSAHCGICQPFGTDHTLMISAHQSLRTAAESVRIASDLQKQDLNMGSDGSVSMQLKMKVIPKGGCDAGELLLPDNLRSQLQQAGESAMNFQVGSTLKAGALSVAAGTVGAANYTGCSAKQAGAAILDLDPSKLPPPVYSYLLNTVYSTMANKPEDFTPASPEGYSKYSIPVGSMMGVVPFNGDTDLIVYTDQDFKPAGGGLSVTWKLP